MAVSVGENNKKAVGQAHASYFSQAMKCLRRSFPECDEDLSSCWKLAYHRTHLLFPELVLRIAPTHRHPLLLRTLYVLLLYLQVKELLGFEVGGDFYDIRRRYLKFAVMPVHLWYGLEMWIISILHTRSMSWPQLLRHPSM